MNTKKSRSKHLFIQIGCTALFIPLIPLTVNTIRIICIFGKLTLRSMIRQKQKIPKLCIGLMVCHTLFPTSSLTHTRIYVNAKIMSKTIIKIVDPKILFNHLLPFLTQVNLFFAARRSSRRI